MPGHKGNAGTGFLKEVLKYDITEIDGFDNLHDAHGVILESERYASSLYGAEETHFLTGGSTSGILSAIAGVTEQGDEILIGRNCHRSVYNAAELGRLRCRYLYPEYIEEYGICGAITAKNIEKALIKYPDIRAVVITSPTYEGVCSDVNAIAGTVHGYGKILIVDAAHGAHFGFHEGFPESAVKQGADIVIHSVHKTLPSPTQTALLHMNGDLADREEVRRMLTVYQSSSPSYLLMAGIDNCMSILGERGSREFDKFFERLCNLEKDFEGFNCLKHINRRLLKEKYGVYDTDPGKIMISVKGTGITGRELYDILRNEHGIQPEMASDGFCLLIMTVMDTEEGFKRVKNALFCIDEKISGKKKNDPESKRKSHEEEADIGSLYVREAKQVMPVYEALSADKMNGDIDKAEGMISAGYICLYPPGIPLLVPGEEISCGLAEGIKKAQEQGLTVQGVGEGGKIKVLAQGR